MLENSGRGIGKNSKILGMPKGHIRDDESSWRSNHKIRRNISVTKITKEIYQNIE